MHDHPCVVIVDDVPDIVETMAMFLELDGYDVRTTTSPLAALDLVELHQPHCVLLDIDMPVMNGLELAAQLRSRHGGGLVLIAITGGAIAGDEYSARYACLDHFLPKPVDPLVLRRFLPPVRPAGGHATAETI